MKKVLLLTVAAMMATMNVSAQDEPKNEIGIFYGVGSASNVVSSFGSAFSFSTGDQTGYWGPIGAEYFYHVSNVIGLGVVAEYAGCKWDKPYTLNGSLKTTYITVMPSVKFNWLRKEHVGLYSGISAGAMFCSITPSGDFKTDPQYKNIDDVKEENVTDFMFNINVIGVEFGTAFRGFAELGFGEKGLFCAGVRYKF